MQVWKHRIGSDPSEDVVVFHETDQSFNVGVYLSRSEKYIFIETGELLLRKEAYAKSFLQRCSLARVFLHKDD